MQCEVCQRTLKEDARYCDFCGAPVSEAAPEAQEPGEIDKKLLFTGIFISLGVTVVINLIAVVFGFPLFFGGLFLPFFFIRKKRQQ